MMLSRLFLALCVVVGTGTAVAAAPLSDRQILGFIDSMVPLTTYAERHGIDMDGPADRADAGPPLGKEQFMQAVAAVRASGHYDGMNAIARKHGFASLENWAETAQRVMRAYMAHAMGEEGAELAAQMREAMAALQADPSLGEEQKRAVLAQMEASSRMVQELRETDPADTRAVAPHIGKLEAMFESLDGSAPPQPR